MSKNEARTYANESVPELREQVLNGDDQERLWQMLDDYLDNHADDFEEGMVAKIRERGEAIDDPERPSRLVFDVERHRAWLGTRYKRGEPMGSFITYWERYSFDPQANTLESLGNVRPSEFTVGASEDQFVHCDFCVKRLVNNRYKIYEIVAKKAAIVENLEGVESFVDDLVSDLCLKPELDTLRDALAPGQECECLKIMAEAIKDALMEEAEYAWREATDSAQ